MIEADIEDAVCKYAVKRGFEHRKLAWVGRKDAPDRIFWKPGVFPFVIEFKKPLEEARRGQLRELVSLAEAGVKGYVVDDIEEGKRIIDAHS